jgi:hypothetical protein
MRATEHPIKLIDSRIDPNTVAIIVLTVENFRKIQGAIKCINKDENDLGVDAKLSTKLLIKYSYVY